MHILHTVHYTFPRVLTRRICLTIKASLVGDDFIILMTSLSKKSFLRNCGAASLEVYYKTIRFHDPPIMRANASNVSLETLHDL